MNQALTDTCQQQFAQQKTRPWPGATPFWPPCPRPKSLRASEVAPGHGSLAALVLLAGRSPIRLASRIDGNAAAHAVQESLQGELKCL